MSLSSPAAVRPIIRLTRRDEHGPITRLMSPLDLGQVLKPFMFLDLFDADRKTVQAMADMPVHPHSGVATVTVPVEGRFRVLERLVKQKKLHKTPPASCARTDRPYSPKMTLWPRMSSAWLCIRWSSSGLSATSQKRDLSEEEIAVAFFVPVTACA